MNEDTDWITPFGNWVNQIYANIFKILNAWFDIDTRPRYPATHQEHNYD